MYNQAPRWTASGQAADFSEQLGELLSDAGYEVDRTLMTDLGIGFAAAVVARER